MRNLSRFVGFTSIVCLFFYSHSFVIFFICLFRKQVDTIPNMAQSSPLKPLVGINGGYFWRVDSQSFFDDVCFGKTRQDALQNVSSEHPNYGVGDCMSKRGQKKKRERPNPSFTLCVFYILCQVLLWSMALHSHITATVLARTDPQYLSLMVSSTINMKRLCFFVCGGYFVFELKLIITKDKTEARSDLILSCRSRFEVLHKGQQVSKDVRNAIGAGPNLVSTVNGSAIEAIPSDDYNVNLLSRAANTAVGLIADAGGVLMSKAVLVTVDGNDHCGFKSNCGVSDHELAYFMKDQLHCASAMGMDQGGSTTMYVQGKGIGGVVNCSDMPNCDGRVRRVYDGLFVAEV